MRNSEHVTRLFKLAVAHDHPQVLEWPTPFVLFQHFGDSGLEFELQAYINDVLLVPVMLVICAFRLNVIFVSNSEDN